ncbi:PAS domain-containing protein [Desulfobacter postgatei]|uniref:PAS domain-containing protein n=1 Tax=Desulfobacter postgatei TaxID=2293 RepID=UPI00259BC312|nr:PAS domain-containing protein [uncultured Desulfobacter sp.]
MKYSFKELVDIEKLQELTDELYMITSVHSAIISMDGEVLTSSGGQRICTDFHRQHPQTLKECIKNDTKIRRNLNTAAPFVIHTCPRGLVDASSQIIIAGEHVANVFSGQVFLEPPDKTKEQFFREQAQKLGFDETEYIKAFREIPICTEKKFRAILSFLSKLAQMVAQLGDTRLNELESLTALQESKKRFDRAVCSTLDGIWEWNILTNEGSFSPRWCEILGYSHDDPKLSHSYNTWASRIHSDDYEYVMAALNAHLKEGTAYNVDYRHLHKSGEYRWQNSRGKAIFDETGNPVRMVGCTRDIHEQKSAEEALRKSEANLAEAQRIAHLGSWEWDIITDEIQLSPEAYRIFGLDPQKMKLSLDDFIDVVHPEDKAYIREQIDKIRNKEVGESYEYRIVYLNGDIRQAQSLGKIFLNKNGMLEKMIGTVQDITDQVQRELQLKESDDRFKRLLNSLNDVAWAADSDGQLLYLNPAAEFVYGRALSKLYANPEFWIEMVHPEDREKVSREAEDLFKNGKVESQYRIVRDDGKIRWLNDRKTVVYNDAGDPVQIGGIARDITKEEIAVNQNKKFMHELGERLKDLDCMYKISNSIRLSKTLDQVFEDVVRFIPPRWQYPESTCCRLRFGEKEYISEKFKKKPWKISSDIIFSNQKEGEIEVFYLKKSILDEAPFLKEEQNLINGICQLLTEACQHHKAQKKIAQINRALKLYSECNKIIVHAENESDVLNSICRIIVEKGNYRFAWIGFVGQGKEKLILPAAQHGCGEGYLDNLNVRWDDTKWGRSPIGRAIRENAPAVSQQISSDPNFAPWRKRAEKRNFLSNISLPLTFKHQVLGALSIYASEKETFSAEEAELLKELANDLTHGIMAIRAFEKQRKIKKNLQSDRNKLQSVLNGVGDSVHVINKDYTIEFQNNVSKDVFGELQGKKCYKSFFQMDEPCEFCLLQESLSENRIQQLETNIADQKRYDIVFSPFQESDEKMKSVIVMRDITEKKRLQAEAMRTGHLASLGELAAGVAHEINNPVTGIISIAEILTDKFHELGGDKKIPERIVHEGERIGNIVKNLLSFARDKKEEHSPVQINDILNLALELVGKQILKDGIHLSVNIPSDMPEIKARSQEIQQVFLNIISNARYALNKKYTKPHENKLLEINGEIIESGQEKYVRLIFYDRGMGIPKKLVDKVAAPFFSTKPQGEGTGLGLSISHGIIKNHGGNLWFESREGEYTKAMVDLPVNNGWQSKEEI